MLPVSRHEPVFSLGVNLLKTGDRGLHKTHFGSSLSLSELLSLRREVFPGEGLKCSFSAHVCMCVLVHVCLFHGRESALYRNLWPPQKCKELLVEILRCLFLSTIYQDSLCSNLQAPCSLTFYLVHSTCQIHSLFSSLNKLHSLRSFFFFSSTCFSLAWNPLLPSLLFLENSSWSSKTQLECLLLRSLPESSPENRSLPPLCCPSSLTLSLWKHFITLCHNVLVRFQQVSHTHEAGSSSRGSVSFMSWSPAQHSGSDAVGAQYISK